MNTPTTTPHTPPPQPDKQRNRTRHSSPRPHPSFSADVDVASATIRVRGALQSPAIDLLRGSVDLLLGAGRHTITLDLAEVTGVDAHGAGFLTALRSDLAAQDADLYLVHVSDQVREALQLFGG